MAGSAAWRRWKVEGMDCPSCVANIEAAVARLPGIHEVDVSLMSETLSARLAPDSTDGGSNTCMIVNQRNDSRSNDWASSRAQ